MLFPDRVDPQMRVLTMAGIRLTDRDIRVLADLGELGLLDFELCRSRHFATLSYERCRQKIAQYLENGLIQAIKLQVWYASDARGGRIPTILCLAELGAEAVHQRTGDYPRHILSSDLAPATFFHRLQVVKVRIAVDSAAQHAGLSQPCWIMERDMRPDAPANVMPHQRRILYHEFTTPSGTFTCQPDAAATLLIPHPNGPPTELAVLFEIDLSTEGLAQCRRKVPGYTAIFQQRSFPYWSHLRHPAIRVFWVVPSDQRIGTLAAALRDFPAAQCFRFTTFAQCNHNVLTQPVWQDVHGTPMTIYQSS